jgi:hypothetical protein
MSNPNPLRSRTNVSLFIGLWIGLTVVAGLCVFAVLFWMMGGFRPAARATAQATGLPTLAVAATDAPGNQANPTTPPEGLAGGSEGCPYPPEPASGFGYGIQSHVFVGDPAYWMGVITGKLHLNWVKMQVRWPDVQTGIDTYFWDVLDGSMNEACNNGLRVMVSLVAAPEFTRAQPMPAPQGQEAPPDDPQAYADFLGKLLDRYPGRIQAVEVWNEMNLEREWNTPDGVSADDYVALLKAAYTTAKAHDPNIIIISGAPAPTGINCHETFPDCPASGRTSIMDDVSYLRAFVDAGGLDYADCVGTHSNGTNLPPTADGNNPPSREGYTFTGPWDNPHYSWALRSQVETYAQILDGRKLQCVTEFGYASPVNGQFPPGYEFAADVTEAQQGEYVVAAYNWMRDSGLVKQAFLFNLDYGPKGGDPATDDNVIFSILTKEGTPRPAFDALSLMPKP